MSNQVKHSFRWLCLVLTILCTIHQITSQSVVDNSPPTSSVRSDRPPLKYAPPLVPPNDESEIPQEIVDLYSDPSIPIEEKWAMIGEFYNDFAWPHRRALMDYLDRAVIEPKLDFNPDCDKALKLWRKGLNESTLWAFESK